MSGAGGCGPAADGSDALARLSRYTLHDAAERGDAALMEALLQAAAREADEDWDPSRPALLAQTVDLNARDNTSCTPLHTCVLFRRLACLRVCLAHKAKLGLRCAGSPLLHLLLSMAPIEGSGGEVAGHEEEEEERGANARFVLEALPLLLAAGADAAALDENGRSALHLAAHLGLAEAAELLLPQPPPSRPPPASAAGTAPVTPLLLTPAPPISPLLDQTDRLGATPLHAAAAGEHLTMLRWLLGRGASAMAADKAGDTPAHTAAKAGWARGAALLRRHMAEPEKCNGAGLTVREALAPRIWDRALGDGDRGGVIWSEAEAEAEAKEGAGVDDDVAMGAGAGAGSAAGAGPVGRGPSVSQRTLVLTHDDCRLAHHTCAPITRALAYVPPENASRLEVLLSRTHGTLRARDLVARTRLVTSAPPARMSDVLRVHEYEYVRRVLAKVGEAHPDPAQPAPSVPPPEGPGSVGSSEGTAAAAAAAAAGAAAAGGIRSLDGDTALSRGSWAAALRAAGAVCAAVDSVVGGQARNAFCPVRPPGHHAGPRGVVACERDPDGSHGFCLLNNVAVGAAYAMHHYGRPAFSYAAEAAAPTGATSSSPPGPCAAEGADARPLIRRVAIFDFDVHHGNGTEAVLRNLVPHELCETVRLPFAHAAVSLMSYRPWLDEHDGANVMFVSSHGYGAKRDEAARPFGCFYPGSGASTGWDVQAVERLQEEAAADAGAGVDAGLGASDAATGSFDAAGLGLLASPRAQLLPDATPRAQPLQGVGHGLATGAGMGVLQLLPFDAQQQSLGGALTQAQAQAQAQGASGLPPLHVSTSAPPLPPLLPLALPQPLLSLATPRTAAASASASGPASAPAASASSSTCVPLAPPAPAFVLPEISAEARAAPPPWPSLQQQPVLPPPFPSAADAPPPVPEPLLEAYVTRPRVVNVAMPHGYGPKMWRRALAADVLPRLAAFQPDLILVSAGFDAHRADAINCGYMRLAEEDYAWVTRQLVKVANASAHGRIVSVLEGGYKVQGRVVSPFARSVAAHVRALAGGIAEKWDSARERTLLLRELRFEQQAAAAAAAALVAGEAAFAADAAAAAAAASGPPLSPGQGRGREARSAGGGGGGSSSSSSTWQMLSSAPEAAAPGTDAAAVASAPQVPSSPAREPAAAEGASNGGGARGKRRRVDVDYAALDAQVRLEDAARAAAAVGATVAVVAGAR